MNKWRQFKFALNRDYVKPHVETNNYLALKKPPSGYPQIQESDWILFVRSHTTKAFQVSLFINFGNIYYFNHITNMFLLKQELSKKQAERQR